MASPPLRRPFGFGQVGTVSRLWPGDENARGIMLPAEMVAKVDAFAKLATDDTEQQGARAGARRRYNRLLISMQRRLDGCCGPRLLKDLGAGMCVSGQPRGRPLVSHT
jgi:hypothetical protein